MYSGIIFLNANILGRVSARVLSLVFNKRVVFLSFCIIRNYEYIVLFGSILWSLEKKNVFETVFVYTIDSGWLR